MNRNAKVLYALLLLLACQLPANATGFFDYGAGSTLTFRDCIGVPVDQNCAQAVSSFSVTSSGGIFSVYDDSIVMDNYGTVQATSSFGGTAAAPIMTASATSTSIGRTGSTGLAVQGYTYIGADSTIVSFGGTMSYVFSGPQNGVGQGAVVGAVYLLDPSGVDLDVLLDCRIPDFCLADPASTILATDLVFSGDQATGGSYSEQVEISFTLEPGQTFFIAALLQAVADRDGSGSGEMLDLGFSGFSPGFIQDLIPASIKASQDTDNDGVLDGVDNCLLENNADQRDTDGDNIGNACDADVAIPNDCIVNFLDLQVYRNEFFMMGDLDTDNNGDNSTNFLDLQGVRNQFFAAPGPSANGCN